MLADSIFTAEHLHALLEDNSIYVIQDLQIVLPNVAPHWARLSKQKKLKNIQVDDLSKEADEQKIFGERFYERLVQVLTKDTANFDIYSKLVPRDSSGTSTAREVLRARFDIILFDRCSCLRRTESLHTLRTARRSVSVRHSWLRRAHQRWI